MALDPTLGVLFRNCKHDGNATSSPDKVRYALQCDNFAVQIARTPIQMPIPGNSPELMDFGIFRPSLSISGLVSTKGGASNIGQKGFEFMEYFDYTRRHNRENGYSNSDTSGYTNRYYFPPKNRIEEDAYKWKTSLGSELELEIVDANQPQLTKFADGSGKDNTDINGDHNSTTEETFTIDSTTIDNRLMVVGDYLLIEGENPASGDGDDLLWEIVKVLAVTDSTHIEAARGQLGSTALTHDNNRNVYFYEEPSGGGVYKVAIQQARFQVDASKEDRWSFQMQYVCKARDDVGI